PRVAQPRGRTGRRRRHRLRRRLRRRRRGHGRRDVGGFGPRDRRRRRHGSRRRRGRGGDRRRGYIGRFFGGGGKRLFDLRRREMDAARERLLFHRQDRAGHRDAGGSGGAEAGDRSSNAWRAARPLTKPPAATSIRRRDTKPPFGNFILLYRTIGYRATLMNDCGGRCKRGSPSATDFPGKSAARGGFAGSEIGAVKDFGVFAQILGAAGERHVATLHNVNAVREAERERGELFDQEDADAARGDGLDGLAKTRHHRRREAERQLVDQQEFR